jgi:hypothetical protein
MLQANTCAAAGRYQSIVRKSGIRFSGHTMLFFEKKHRIDPKSADPLFGPMPYQGVER